MKTFRYVLCDVFTSRALEGNQLAVFTDARGLSGELMQRLASELRLSETTFILPPEQGGHAKVRIFTPNRELPFAGHPTLGTALVIASSIESREVRLELGVGTVPVSVEREGARVSFGWMKQPLPEALAFEHDSALLEALGVRDPAVPNAHYSNGPGHHFVAVRTRAELAALAPDFQRLARLTPHLVSVFCVDPEGVKTRVFAPAAGVFEDPATGSAAGPLGVHLVQLGKLSYGETLRIEQGAELGRPSELFVRIGGEGTRVSSVEVGGGVQIVARGEFRLA
ncbi:MAG TPA: PhzF family phenazine biosynthesis protein [Polyangiaceae bacterium]|nr:PhzF family phenazine biosynthesis protein [Polyangiaceae bacterium]